MQGPWNTARTAQLREEEGLATLATVASLSLASVAVALGVSVLNWTLVDLIRSQNWDRAGIALLAHRIHMDFRYSSASMAFECRSQECLVIPASPVTGLSGVVWREAVGYRNGPDGVETVRMAWDWQAGPPCDPDDDLCRDWPDTWVTVASGAWIRAFRDPGGTLTMALGVGGTTVHEAVLVAVNP